MLNIPASTLTTQLPLVDQSKSVRAGTFFASRSKCKFFGDGRIAHAASGFPDPERVRTKPANLCSPRVGLTKVCPDESGAQRLVPSNPRGQLRGARSNALAVGITPPEAMLSNSCKHHLFLPFIPSAMRSVQSPRKGDCTLHLSAMLSEMSSAIQKYT